MPYHPGDIIGLIPIMLGVMAFMLWIFLTFLRWFSRKELTLQREVLEAKFQAEKELQQVKQEVQEETFKQISRELHDNVGQTFSLAKLGLARLPLENLAEARAGVSEISDIMSKGISDLRDISTSMNAELVHTTGLENAIKAQLLFLDRTGHFRTFLQRNGNFEQMELRIELILYRIFQEALNNIIRHANAAEVNIELSNGEDRLRMVIEDDGTGFDTEQLASGRMRKGGIGNMVARANSIGAECRVESHPGQGTKIIITKQAI